MSRHIPRRERWSKLGPAEYRSGGITVRYAEGAWWAWISYRQREAGTPGDYLLPSWEDHCERLGPFKRPRNTMVAAEQHVTFLRRHYKDDVHVETGGPGSAGT